MQKLLVASLCVLACAASLAVAGTANPIAISLDAPLVSQRMNATDGNFYTYAVTSSRISSFWEYRFRATLAPGAYVASNSVTVRAYWRMPDSTGTLTWQAMTPSSYYTLSFDAVATAGMLNMAIDAKVLFEGMRSLQVTPQTIGIGFLVTTDSNLPAVRNGLFTASLREVQALQAVDANGDVPFGSASTEYQGTCPGTSGRCMVVANMQYHDHRYLMATASARSGSFYSVILRSPTILTIDGSANFNGGAGPLTVRTCWSNSSCEIEQAYYYLELRTSSTQTVDAEFTVTFSQGAGALAQASASLVTVAAAAAVAFLASRSH